MMKFHRCQHNDLSALPLNLIYQPLTPRYILIWTENYHAYKRTPIDETAANACASGHNVIDEAKHIC